MGRGNKTLRLDALGHFVVFQNDSGSSEKIGEVSTVLSSLSLGRVGDYFRSISPKLPESPFSFNPKPMVLFSESVHMIFYYLLSNSLLFSMYICRPHYNIRSRNVFAFENGNDEHLVFLLLSVVYSVGKERSSCIDGWFVYWRTRLNPIYRNNKVKPMELGLKMLKIL